MEVGSALETVETAAGEKVPAPMVVVVMVGWMEAAQVAAVMATEVSGATARVEEAALGAVMAAVSMAEVATVAAVKAAVA